MNALAVATLLALGTGSVLAAGRVETDGLQFAQSFDQFIVKYRDGTAPRANAANLQRALDTAAGAAGNRAQGPRRRPRPGGACA